jgi:hypothetical protein
MTDQPRRLRDALAEMTPAQRAESRAGSSVAGPVSQREGSVVRDSPGGRPERLPPARRYWPILLIAAVSLLQCGRLISFTLKNAVNILFWDQWDLYTPFFQHASLWRIFDWQFVTPRLGIGAVFASILAGLTRWNTRSEALAIVGIVFAATLAAVYLKRRLFGSLSATDVVIPLLFLSRAQYEMLVGATNLSHGPFPLLLTMLMCLAWIQPNRLVRYGLVVLVNFLMIFTAFGLFMGLITPPLLAIDCYGALRDRQKGALAGGMLALGIALLSLGSFFIGYASPPAIECSRWPCGNVLAYPWFAALMFANVFGFKALHLVTSSAVGIAVLACVVGVLFHHLRLTSRGDGEAERTSRIVVILLGYSLLFGVATAIGRVGRGLNAADGSRYYLYVTIGILGLYFHLLTLGKTAIRRWGLAVLLTGSVVAGFHMTPLDEGTVSRFRNGKTRWRSCYLRTEDIEGCDEAAGFMIYPRPEATGLKAKLDYLKRHRLNLYADDP